MIQEAAFSVCFVRAHLEEQSVQEARGQSVQAKQWPGVACRAQTQWGEKNRKSGREREAIRMVS